jgi:hypothetical protein
MNWSDLSTAASGSLLGINADSGAMTGSWHADAFGYKPYLMNCLTNLRKKPTTTAITA